MFERFVTGSARETTGILNFWGHAGLGKTALLHRLRQTADDALVPVIVLDLRVQTTPLVVLRSIHEQLPTSRVAQDLDAAFAAELRRLERIYVAFAQTLVEVGEDSEAGSASSAAERVATAGGVVGELVGAFFGVPLGGRVGEKAGSALGQNASKVKAVLAEKGVDDADLRALFDAPRRLKELLIRAVEERLGAEGQPYALLVDHYEHAAPPVAAWLRDEILPQFDVLVRPSIFSRAPLTQSMPWEYLAPVITSRELAPFTEEESREFWATRGISDPVKVRFLTEVTDGHPYKSDVVAELVNRQGENASFGDLRNLIEAARVDERLEHRYLSEASAEDRLLLRACAVPRWFDHDLLTAISPELADAYDRVRSISFIERTTRGVLAMHSLAREAILHEEQLSAPLELKALHLAIAEHLSQRRAREGALGGEHLGDEIYHRLAHDERTGLEVAVARVRDARLFGSHASEDIIWAELAAFPVATSAGERWRRLAKAHVARRNGDWEAAAASCERLLGTAWQGDEFDFWLAQLRRELLVGRGSYEEAFDLEQETLEAAAATLAPRLVHELLELHALHIETGAILSRFEEAFEALDRALHQAKDDELATARIALAGATARRLRGDLHEGRALAREAVGTYRKVRDPKALCFALIQMSRLETHAGEWIRAEHLLEEAEELEREATDRYNRANILLFRGNIRRKRGQFTEALALYDESLRMHVDMKSDREIGPLYGSIALINIALGDFGAARSYLDASFEMKRSQSYMRGVGITFKYEGLYHLAQHDLEHAVKSFQQARKIGAECGVRYVEWWAQLGLIRCSLRQAELRAITLIGGPADRDGDNLADLAGAFALYGGAAAADSSRIVAGLRRMLTYNPYWAYEVTASLREDMDASAMTASDHDRITGALLKAAQDPTVADAERVGRGREHVGTAVPTLEQALIWRAQG